MAENKYLDLQGLALYDEKIKALIKAGDEAQAAATGAVMVQVLQDAEKYTDEQIAALKLSETYALKKTEKDAADAKAAAEEALAAIGSPAVEEVSHEATQDDVDAGLAENVGDKVVDVEAQEASGLQAKVDALEEALGEDGSVAEQVSDAIEALDLENTYAKKDIVDTLVGDDAEKSVREIAVEALAEALIPEDAQDALDTLEEIAAWIQAHPEDAATMNADIEALKAAVGEAAKASTEVIVGYKDAEDNVIPVEDFEALDEEQKALYTPVVEGDPAQAATGLYKEIEKIDKATDARLDALEVALGMKDPDTEDGENKTVTEQLVDLEEKIDQLGQDMGDTYADLSDRLFALEDNSYIAITDEEINALFAVAEEEPTV